jgi:hypothetical protein
MNVYNTAFLLISAPLPQLYTGTRTMTPLQTCPCNHSDSPTPLNSENALLLSVDTSPSELPKVTTYLVPGHTLSDI